jgi:hypothetical protein
MFALTLALTVAAFGGSADSTSMIQAGSYPFRYGTAVRLDTARDLAFVGAGSGVYIVDVADPARPRVVSDRIRCGTMVKDLFLDGDRLYVALFSFSALPDQPRDVEIWDVALPASPLRLGGLNLSFGAQCVYARGDTLLVGSWQNLLSFDVSDPGRPLMMDSLFSGILPEEICVRDSLAFISGSGSGVTVYDTRLLAHPVRLAQWGASGSFPGLTVAGDRLYLASSFGPAGSASGLRVYDITAPLNGRLLGAFDTVQTGAYRVVLADTVALVTYAFDWSPGTAALKAVSVADPGAPTQLCAHGRNCLGVSLRDTLAYVAFLHRFEVLNFASPARPALVGSLPLGLAGGRLAVDRGLIYSVGGSFAVLDARSGLDIELAGSADLGGACGALAQQDSMALVALEADTGGWRVDVVALSDPRRPHVVGSLPTGARARCLAIRGALGYVGSDSGLAVFDVGGLVRIGGNGRRVRGPRLAIRDSLLFACDDGDMLVFSIGDPATPMVVLDTALDLADFLVRDTFLYALAEWGGRVSIYSIADPVHPRLVAEAVSQPGTLRSAAIDDTLLAFGSDDRVTIQSIAVPDRPRTLVSAEVSDALSGLALVGDTLYTSLVTRYRLVREPSGIELERVAPLEPNAGSFWPSVAYGVVSLRDRQQARLLDACGRCVALLGPGRNDVSRLSPGVYFVCSESGAKLGKVIIQR